MIKALSLAAALAVLPLSAAVAQEARGPDEVAIEAAAAAFEARMETFGELAELIENDESLTDAQRGTRIAALWTEYQPDVAAFTAVVTEHAGGIAAEVLANLDIEALVAEALSNVDVGEISAQALAQVQASGALTGALAGAQGMAMNGSWASNDPEHMATYGLMADYAVGEALDAVRDAGLEIDADAHANADDVDETKTDES